MAYCKVASAYKHKKRRTKCSGKRKNPCIRAIACTWTGKYRAARRGRKAKTRAKPAGRRRCVWGAKTHRCHLAKR